MSNKPVGTCHICGVFGKLSYEHIPPEAAFNDHMVLLQTMRDMDTGRTFRSRAKGYGEYTLCEKCNSNTGGWYGTAFVEWTRQGMTWLDKVTKLPAIARSGILLRDVYPLRVFKQVVVMAFSVNDVQWRDAHEDLVRFVLNREQNTLPSDYKMYIHLAPRGLGRLIGTAAFAKAGAGISSIFSEIVRAPFGYIFTPRSLPAPIVAEHQLTDITYFAQYEYRQRSAAWLKPAILETHLPIPLAYRSRLQIAADWARNTLELERRRIENLRKEI